RMFYYAGKVIASTSASGSMTSITLGPINSSEVVSPGHQGIQDRFLSTNVDYIYPDLTLFQKVNQISYGLADQESGGKIVRYLTRSFNGDASSLCPMDTLKFTFDPTTPAAVAGTSNEYKDWS